MLNLVISLRKILRKYILIFFILILISLNWIFLTTFNFLPYTSKTGELILNPLSADAMNTTQWLKNPNFESPVEYWNPTITGDQTDVNASIHSGEAHYEILGDKQTYSLIADPPLVLNWLERDNPYFPTRPDLYEITSAGCRVSHEFDDVTAVQNPSIQWEQNISMNVDMSDYIIKSASIKAIVNATVDENLDRFYDYIHGYFARTTPNDVIDTYSVGDYVRFFVSISDLEKNKIYEIAYFQTSQIGIGNPPGKDYLYDTYMVSVPQEVLIFYLESVLDTDNSNFTLSLGINLHIEDNLASYWDLDTFDELIIKYVNFTFTYEKKIDQYTSISWSQKGSQIRGDNIKILDATLNFNYKVNINWSETLSPNSELRILISNNELEKTIKLKDFEITFQDLNLGSDEIKPYILPNVNFTFSIMIFLADEFALDQIITFSIDDVYLTISYIIISNESFPYSLIWIILIILSFIIAILTCLSLRSYIFIPRKLKKRTALLSRTQKFKDANNIQGILLIHNPTGLPLFSRNYSDLMEVNKTLFSGFLQAISIVGEEVIRKDYVKSKGIQTNLVDGIHNVLELDFKHFYCLISDIEELRTVLILNNKASKRIKRQLLNFGLNVYAKYSEILMDWNHETNIFLEGIPPLIDNFFSMNYKLFYKVIIEKSDLEKLKKELKLSKIDVKILNEILSIAEEDHIFKLITILNKLSNRSEDLVINTIEVLIKKKLLIPADSIEILI
ncbi:MAG: hypothetical protein ACFFE5_00785 [Candidatus Thorarchaeota archaeon]